MAFSTGNISVSLEDILNKVTEAQILSYYLGIKEIPTFINSPLREDKRPSFGIYCHNSGRIYYTDMSTGDKGGLFDLLGKMWNIKYTNVLRKIHKDIPNMSNNIKVNNYTPTVTKTSNYSNKKDVKVKIREWRSYDIEYWESYGITLEWLKYAEVYPVSQIFIIKNGETSCFPADKLAYTYVERKEGKVTLKVYQPMRKSGYGKWINKHDRSVISLWTKVPEYGDKLCICSSLKDALCLWANTNIPAISLQGEGYGISNTAINELKRRYKKVYILLDNDEAGLIDGKKLAESTGFINIVLPQFNEGKDISDYYSSLQDKSLFKQTMLNLFK